MTYKEVAENLVALYANYVEICTENGVDYEDFSEEIVVAVEALLIRADQEKMRAMEKNAISHLSAVAPTPTIQPSVNQWIEQGFKLSDYPMNID